MKMFFSISVLLLLFTHSAQCQYTHLKEYGLHGRVKKMVTYSYIHVIKTGKGWKPLNDDAYLMIVVSFFNPKGLLDSVVSKIGSDDFTNTTIYQYRNNQLSGTETYTATGIVIESCAIKWSSPLEYTLECSTIGDTVQNTRKLYLKKNFRSYKFENKTMRLKDSTMKLSFTDTYHLNSNGSIGLGIKQNNVTGSRTALIYKHDQFDRFKNPLVTIIFDEATGKPDYLFRREFFYY